MKSKKPLPTIIKKERKQRFSLTFAFSLVVMLVLLSAIALAAASVALLAHFKLIADPEGDLSLGTLILLMALISLVLGSVLFFFSSKIPLRPINDLINMMNRLAAGDFKARLRFRGAFANHPAFEEITESFNKMAEELENTELLRSDFINNFSHEFKTPIVSIAGFAELLSGGGLTEEERAQYISAIGEESRRLASMATNILHLSKVERQAILTDVTSYNLSEQLRSSLLLFEEKWSAKGIEVQIDLEEYTVEANEELLKQVWINLIDNAVKFTPRCGTVALEVAQEADHLAVTVKNTGSEIPPHKQKSVFQKFYQADESRAAEGSGIGLAIVKHAVELHGGSITLQSEHGITAFTVRLPQKQAGLLHGTSH